MKIFCIGRNYVAHAGELGNAIPSSPVFFIKPATSLLRGDFPFRLPDFSDDIQHEVELVYRISRPAHRVAPSQASQHYDAVGIGLDLTARDLQRDCKERGLPWEMAKGFDNSAPVSAEFLPLSEFPPAAGIDFRLERNGQVVQRGNSREMLFDVDTLVSHISRYVTMEQGDLLFTGTPSGVGRLAAGDDLRCFIGDRPMLHTRVL